MASTQTVDEDPSFGGPDGLQHAMRTPLTVMVLRVQVVAKRIEACQTIADEERQALQRHLAAFDEAARQLVQILDACRGEQP